MVSYGVSRAAFILLSNLMRLHSTTMPDMHSQAMHEIRLTVCTLLAAYTWGLVKPALHTSRSHPLIYMFFHTLIGPQRRHRRDPLLLHDAVPRP